ncbi:MAG: FAD-dependent monooxygenase [Anaerosomatales bacterium]|nr:FAD-dependent monooxygenase [Anaerosomatales bacterium]
MQVLETPRHDRYGTVVAGAGPAGILAALHAATSGRVLLVDSSGLPRDKSCGGMLHHHTVRTLERYDRIPPGIVLDPRTVHFRYNDWDRRITKTTTLEFLNVSRAGFDEWLTTLLPDTVDVVAPCELRDFRQSPSGVDITLKTRDGDVAVSSDVLVGADGARSQVRRVLEVPSTATYVTLQDFCTVQESVAPVFDCIYMRDIGDQYAYSYVVPKGPTAIVGSVYYPKTKHPWEKQDLTLDILRERMPGLGPSVKREAAAALYLRSPDDVVCGRGRVLLAGEAGGFMSPTSGEGISYAVNTGRLAGEAIGAGDAAGALSRYAAAVEPVRRNIARKFRWLPFMESRAGKYVAGFMPEKLVSKVTEGL